MLVVRDRITLFFGIFSVMALSNAIVPVLPSFAGSASWSGAIYSAYFLGAFISTLPAGILSDRFGRPMLMRTGLALTIASGAALCLPGSEPFAFAARFAEGIGAGLFVAPAMAVVNSQPEHEKLSGYFLALMNAGLVLGLIGAGVLAAMTGYPAIGIFLFTALALVPAFSGLVAQEPPAPPSGQDITISWSIFGRFRWVLYSSVVLIGATGVATSLYPEYSALPPDAVGFWIAGMSIATIISVLVVSRFPLNDIRMIRVSSLLMGAGMLVLTISPAGLLILGAVAGLVMVAQMELLSGIRKHQGIAMGLFTTSSYLGMAVLPLFAGLVADAAGITAAFAITALIACTALFTVVHE